MTSEGRSKGQTFSSYQQTSAGTAKQQEDHSDNEEQSEKAIKRNADTDAKNPDYVEYLRIREETNPKNIQAVNKENVTGMCSGRPLKKRLDVPEGVEINQYSGQ